jgi:hypothetical protein
VQKSQAFSLKSVSFKALPIFPVAANLVAANLVTALGRTLRLTVLVLAWFVTWFVTWFLAIA